MPKSESAAVQCYVFDFTFFGKDGLPDHETFIGLIRPLFKKWVFQQEACPTTGRPHYQGRGSLIKKKRKGELCALLNSIEALKGMSVDPSATCNHQDEMFYSMKYDTRTAGPWSDVTYTKPAYIPRHFRGLMDRLYPWQVEIMDSRHTFDDRFVNLVYDPAGCKGKSTTARLSALHHRALFLPPVGDAKQLLESACDILMAQQNRSPALCFVDLPRSLTIDKRKFGPLMIAIEEIKGGRVYDMRNHWKEWWFDSPATWVFCNHLPHVNMMSADRWRFWMIRLDGTLRRVPKSEMSQMSQEPGN